MDPEKKCCDEVLCCDEKNIKYSWLLFSYTYIYDWGSKLEDLEGMKSMFEKPNSYTEEQETFASDI